MNETYWKLDEGAEYPPLSDDIRCGCLVIGGGLCGVLTAYQLGKRGIDTVLIEKERLGNGKTAGTTAKATVCHNTAYSDLSEKLSAESARKYAAANMAGLSLLREITDDSCDAETCDMFLYSLYGERRIMREYNRMREFGIDCVYSVGTPVGFELPIEVKSAVCVRNQLKFHPLKTVRHIAALAQPCVKIYEQTEAESLADHVVKTKNGHTIRGEKIIIATNYPMLVPKNLNFLKLYRETSYGAALLGLPALSHMYYGIDGGYAYRSHGETLIVSGERNRDTPPPNTAEKLIQAAEAMFGKAELLASWSNNDCHTHDGMPYAGTIGDGVFLASGFSSWGMTNSAAAAIILSHMAAGERIWYADGFSPSRHLLKSGGDSLLNHIAVSVSGMAKNLTVPEHTLSEIKPGCAEIISYNGHRAGAYRDENGKTYLVSLKCPHLGCSLEWNPAARTWDCPCHGSRFSYDGTCIGEPSTKGIGLT